VLADAWLIIIIGYLACVSQPARKSFIWRKAGRICIMPAMAALLSQARNAVRHATALVLVLWFSGFVCFMGCEMNASAAPAATEEASETADSCPMASRDCCQKPEGNLPTSVETVPDHHAPSCCPLKGQTAEHARKAGNLERPLAATESELSFALNFHPTPKFSPDNLPVANKGSTYLRCCVFRI
jgi:hypothetical protein